MPTHEQALKAFAHLSLAHDAALIAHHLGRIGPEHGLSHLWDLDVHFRKAAAALGYELRVPKTPAQEHAEALARRVAERRCPDHFDTVELGLR